jgi:hypothetical protein
MNRKPPNKPCYGHGWKESPRKPLGKSVGLSGRMIDIGDVNDLRDPDFRQTLATDLAKRAGVWDEVTSTGFNDARKDTDYRGVPAEKVADLALSGMSWRMLKSMVPKECRKATKCEDKSA